MNADAAAARLQALAAGFREHACGELQRMRERLADTDTADEARAELAPLLHRLAGSGATFGFEGLARRARALQQALQGDGVPPPAASLITALDAARSELARDALPREDTATQALRGVSVAAAGPDAIELHMLGGIADDDGLGAQLAALGYRLRTFRDADAVPATWRTSPPGAVLVDLDGIPEPTVASSLHARLPRSAQVPLVCISADDAFATRLAAVRLGAQEFLRRPLDAVALADRLEALQRRCALRQYRVLLVGADAAIADRRVALEGQGFEVRQLADAGRALQVLQRFRPDIAVLDSDLGPCSGDELAGLIRMHDDWLALPIVCLAAAADDAARADGGVVDVLDRGIADAPLAAALRARCDRARALAELMQRDGLTGLLTHARIKEQLVAEVARSRRGARPLAVAMLDLDRFKQVNDRFGHVAGDRVLATLARLLRQRIRRQDSAGRYGGEEFLLLLPDCTTAAAVALVDDIRRRFATLRFSAGNEAFGVTLSAGVAGDRTLGAAELLLEADRALYRAKQDGRDRVVGPD